MTIGKVHSLKSRITKASTFYTEDLYKLVKRKRKNTPSYNIFKDVVDTYYSSLVGVAIKTFYMFELPSHLGTIRLYNREPYIRFDSKGEISRTNYPVKKSRKEGSNILHTYDFTVSSIFNLVMNKGKFKNNTRYTFLPSKEVRKQVSELYEKH